MKTYLLLFFAFVLNACTISSVQDRENITTYDPSVDISHIEFEGGNGESAEEAIVILKARNQTEGIASQYSFLKKIYGEPNANWKLLQLRTKEINDRKFDVLKIKDLKTNSIHTYYFNTGNFKVKS